MLTKKLMTKILGIFVISGVLSIFIFSFPAQFIYGLLELEKLTVLQWNIIAFANFSFSILFFIGMFYLLFRPTLLYIRNIEAGIRAMGEGNLERTIPVKGKDELSSLSRNINQMAAELKDRFEYQKKLEKEKNELIANISHDLRTPLTSITGFLSAVREERYESEQEKSEFIDISYLKSLQLERLINDLFDLTTLSDNQANLAKQRVNLNLLLQQFVMESEGTLPEDMQVALDLSKESVWMEADTENLIRVFENLLTNAVRYSLKPSTLTIQTTIEQEENVLISFSNPASPLSDEEVDQLFKRFYKKDQSRASTGSGLGLAIVKSIIQMHDGKVWATSEQGNFTIIMELPRTG
ncbi:ATP-binding protein [Sutcliffiella horikoshii]|uniref:HAMP domain-containing sensor histidine kinase n=1 Tax=Sutcliffiella horikoshii TaxID=79883 RepID=UPI001F3B2681|nr:ATP-binding protein [Sutcliffiella horikoshii]MCG1023386.1 HAMP domain-containing protein [Sutcliffiella horikoshii]